MSSTDLDAAIESFRTGVAAVQYGDGLLPRSWDEDDWKELFGFTSTRQVKAGDALIRSGVPDRTLYFVLRGTLEVVVRQGDGLSMGPLTQVGAGSVLGEQSFFDGRPRSASAWAVDDCEVALMTPDQYASFEDAHPSRARELLFALGRILAIRLRNTTARVVGGG